MAAQSNDKDFPWWLLTILVLAAWVAYQFSANPLYTQLLQTLSKGLWITVYVSLIGFALASILGMGLALASLSKSLLLRQSARFYIEIIRGIPMMVLLLYVAFVLAPALVMLWNAVAEPLGLGAARTRDFSMLWRAVLALCIGYSAFIAEVFRAGLQSVDEGQSEAAQSLGLNRWQRFRHIVFPQAFRTILPPLGNDFVAMVKDSSLVSVLGVADITQLGKVTAAGNFRYFETYNMVAILYLSMTVALSIGLKQLEKKMRRKETYN